MTRREIDPEQIANFVDAIFRHASAGQFVSLRTFEDCGGSKPLNIHAVEVNGAGLKPVTEAAVMQAQWAADHSKKAVFCPPLAGFSSKTKADEAHLLEGYTLSVECDEYPHEARQKLEALLGPATLVVASGGSWVDGATGEVQDKLHLHWRLNEPATGDGLKLLKEARRLATALVGGDCSNVPIVHPIRWPGSWHRKGEPRLARIVSKTENEIVLGESLQILRQARREQPETTAESAAKAHQDEREDKRSTAELIANITSGRQFHPSTVSLAARWIGSGMHPGAVVNHIRELMEAVPPGQRDFRWQTRYDAVPKNVTSAQTKFGESSGEALFDPWANYPVPAFPIDILPDPVRRFVMDQSKVIGCDPSAMAVAVLGAFSGALDHRIRLKMLRNGSWFVSPRLWILLVGPPSVKKTPTINVALAPIEAHQNEVMDAYAVRLAEYEAAMKRFDKKSGVEEPEEPAKPPRYVVSDITVEKLAEIAARKPRGLLVKRDEFAGFIGSMEKYGGRGGGMSDRAFWLQGYDGGSYTVDRIQRGEVRVENLSVSIIGGIQPDRLAELQGLTSDGLLQRFLPVMLQAPSFPQDIPVTESVAQYNRLVRRMIGTPPCGLALADDAVPVMDELRRHLHAMEQVSDGFARGFQAFLGKLPAVAGSLALILHLAEDPHEQRLHPVSRRVVENVQRLVTDFLLPHANEFYRTAETVTDGDRLQRLASWIVTSGKLQITARDLSRNVRDLRGASLKDVHARVSPLVAGGWLTPLTAGPENRAWNVSPEVARQFAERCRIEDERKATLARLMGSPRRAS